MDLSLFLEYSPPFLLLAFCGVDIVWLRGSDAQDVVVVAAYRLRAVVLLLRPLVNVVLDRPHVRRQVLPTDVEEVFLGGRSHFLQLRTRRVRERRRAGGRVVALLSAVLRALDSATRVEPVRDLRTDAVAFEDDFLDAVVALHHLAESLRPMVTDGIVGQSQRAQTGVPVQRAGEGVRARGSDAVVVQRDDFQRVVLLERVRQEHGAAV